MAVRLDFHLIRDFNPGAEEDIGADDDIRADLGVETEIDRRRIDQRRAAGHGGAAEPRLQHRFGDGEIAPRINTEQLLHIALDGDARMPPVPRQGDHVGEVDLALGVVGRGAVKKRKQMRPGDRHHARIAEPDQAFLIGRVAIFDDGLEPAAVTQFQPAVFAGRSASRRRPWRRRGAAFAAPLRRRRDRPSN